MQCFLYFRCQNLYLLVSLLFIFIIVMSASKAQPANVKVFCRFRPFNNQELQAGNSQPVQNIISDRHLTIKDPYKEDELTFIYDKIFDTCTTQQKVYREVGAPILQNILDGFNGTIIAYGQTSSGKTYTIQGNGNDQQNKGIIPRIIQNLFIAIEKSPPSTEFKLKVSILELYMQKLYDLIDNNRSDLKIRQSKNDGPYVEGKTQVYISDKFELLRLMSIAQKNRVTCSTSMNSNSSRSHLIFQLTLSQFNSQTEQAKVSNLFIVDLAGSQKVSRTGAQGKILQQAKKINLSLASLAKVIKSLSQKISHVPYRDSKLTRIIQDSLGGNSKTTLILTCSPSQSNICQTISTLRFGETAQKIKNKPKINRQPTIKQLQNAIIKLQNKLRLKDQWISTLQAHIKNKLGIALPKKEVLKTDRLYSTMDLDTYINGETVLKHLQQDPNPEYQKQMTSYSIESLRIPMIGKISSEHLLNEGDSYEGSQSNDRSIDQRIASLQYELSICKTSLSSQTTKNLSLTKQLTEISQRLKATIQQNINYQVKNLELQQFINSFNPQNTVNEKGNFVVQNLFNDDDELLISDEQTDNQDTQIENNFTIKINEPPIQTQKQLAKTQKQAKLAEQNAQNKLLNMITKKKSMILSRKMMAKSSLNLNRQPSPQSQACRCKQQNQILTKMCEQMKSQKQILELKMKKKQKKIQQLKEMIEQIQEQMQLMAEQCDEPAPNFNTKIANPIKRSAIICQ